METVLVVDADSVLGRVLCGELAAGGYAVLAHVRREGRAPFPDGVAPDGVTVVRAPRVDAALAGWNRPEAPIAHVVFGEPPPASELLAGALEDRAGMERLIAALDAGLDGFLAELRAVGALLTRREGGQIWVLTRDDGAGACPGGTANPIEARARHAVVKSFAREIARFGVRLNAAAIQPVAEEAGRAEWQAARDALKLFALRFKPVTAAAVARTLHGFLRQADLPIAGMIVPIGIGFAEGNV